MRIGHSAAERYLDQRRVDDTWRLRKNLRAPHMPKQPRAKTLTSLSLKTYTLGGTKVAPYRRGQCCAVSIEIAAMRVTAIQESAPIPPEASPAVAS